MSAKKSTIINRSRTATTPKHSTPNQSIFSGLGSRHANGSKASKILAAKSSYTWKKSPSPSAVTSKSPVLTTPSGDLSYKTWKESSDFRTPHFVRGTPQAILFQNEISTPLSEARVDSKQERLIKLLQKENEELKSELLFIRSLYRQLVEESPYENFDERRINLLKSKTIQLERQVLLLSSALNARSTMLLEVENTLARVREDLRYYMESMAAECHQEHLERLVALIESTRISLYKTIQDTDPESLSIPFVFMTPFIKQTSDTWPVSVLDVCSGKLEHINLKQVAKLESRLCRLYKQMACLREELHFKSEETASSIFTCEHIGGPIRKRLCNHVTTVSQSLEECCSHLLSLSLLYPNAPWPPLKNPIRPDLTEENVMAHMPSLGKKKQQEVGTVVETLIKVFNYTKHILSLEIKILKDEVTFHQAVYQLQVDYSESLLGAVRSAYQEFERNAAGMICAPLSVILTRYNELKDTASEDALRSFLSAFKENADQLADAVDCLQAKEGQETSGASVISDFGEHFFSSLNSLLREHVTKRDANMKELLDKKIGGQTEIPAETVREESGNEPSEQSRMTENSPSFSAQSSCGRNCDSMNCEKTLQSMRSECLENCRNSKAKKTSLEDGKEPFQSNRYQGSASVSFATKTKDELSSRPNSRI